MLKNLTNGSIQFPSADPISNKAKIIAGGLGSGLGLGLGVYARQKLREQAVEKGMENFYNKHNQLPIAPPTQQTKTAELLKTASNVGDISKSIVGKIRSVADVMHHKLPSKPKINVNANTTAKINGVLEELAKARRTDEIIGTVGAAAMLGGLAYGGKLLYDDYKEKKRSAGLLKTASEDAENEAKLAFVYEVMEDKEIGQEVTDEVESLLADVDEALEKNAGVLDSLRGGASAIGNAAKGAAGAAKPYAGAAALGAAGIVGSALVNDLYSAARLAVTRNRNFKNMLEADPELKEHPAEKVKALFNTLHEKGGPEMSGDPLIASAFVKQQLELPPQFLLESVHKLVGTGSTLAKSKQMGSFDLSKMMRGDGQGMAKQLGAAAGKSMMNKGVSEGPRGIGGERCAVCGSNDVTVSNKAGLIFSDCEDCGHTW